jgi:hypothetical protein
MALVVVIPVLSDNYSYLLIDEASRTAAAVDPVDPEKVLQTARDHQVFITHILTTHSHADHDGGNAAMAQFLPHVIVCGGKNDHVRAVTHEVDHDDLITVGQLQVMTPRYVVIVITNLKSRYAFCIPLATHPVMSCIYATKFFLRVIPCLSLDVVASMVRPRPYIEGIIPWCYLINHHVVYRWFPSPNVSKLELTCGDFSC